MTTSTPRFGPVHVFDTDSPATLACVRSLGRAGVPVVVCAHARAPVARFSRHATRWVRCPPLAQADAFASWLSEEVGAGRIQSIVPTSDVVCFHLASVRADLPLRLRDLLPTREAMFDGLMKDRFAAALQRHGIPAPRTWAPTSYEALRAIAAEAHFPVVIKPRSHVGDQDRGRVVDDANTLFTAYRRAPSPAGHDALLARHRDLLWPIVQEYVPDALTRMISIGGLLGPNGDLVAAAASRKVSQWPPRMGVGTRFVPHDDEGLIAYGVDVARKILGRGLFELELVRDGDRWLALDLNPRSYGQIALDIARGHDLPLWWHRLATGEEIPRRPPVDAELVHGVPWHLGEAVAVWKGPARGERLAQWWEQSRRPRVDIVHDDDDPLPTLPHVAGLLRHPRALLRAFVQPGR